MHHWHCWGEILLHPAISPFSSLQAQQCLSWAGFAVARLSSELIQIPKAAGTCASKKKVNWFVQVSELNWLREGPDKHQSCYKRGGGMM